MPRSPPPGVFVVESKSYAGSVSVHRGELFVNSRRTPIVAQVYRETAAVEEIVGPDLRSLELRVEPILCIHRATLPLIRSSVAGIPIVSGPGLVSQLRDRRAVLSADQVRRLADRIDRALPPAR